jgi:hypothetical protein
MRESLRPILQRRGEELLVEVPLCSENSDVGVLNAMRNEETLEIV